MWKRFKAGTHAIELTKSQSETLERLADAVRRAFLLLSDWRNLVVDGLNSAVLGWLPYAYPVGGGPIPNVGVTITLPANGGAVAILIPITAPMKVATLSFYSNDAAGARSLEWALYQQVANESETGEEVCSKAVKEIGTYSTAASTVGAKSSSLTEPERIMPGAYWLVLRNTHAANTFGLGGVAYGTASLLNLNMTQTLATALGDELDLFTGWTKVGDLPAVVVRGAVLGQAGAF